MPDRLTVYENIIAWLDANGVDYRRVEHGPTRTSEESAAARGEPIQVGGKALVMKVGDAFSLFVISAALKADAAAIRAKFGTKKSRFATSDELLELTGLVPGSVPPFGRPILDLDLYADESIAANDRIAFNAGSLTQSVVMPIADYLRLSQPVVFKFGLPA